MKLHEILALAALLKGLARLPWSKNTLYLCPEHEQGENSF